MKLFRKGFVLILCVFVTLLAGCANKYIGKPAENYQRFSCVIKSERCGILWQNDSKIVYDVKVSDGNTYQVNGYVDYNVKHAGIRDYVVFYLLFMSDDQVVHERRVKTFTTNGEFDFEFTSDEAVTTSTVENLRLYVRT